MTVSYADLEKMVKPILTMKNAVAAVVFFAGLGAVWAANQHDTKDALDKGEQAIQIGESNAKAINDLATVVALDINEKKHSDEKLEKLEKAIKNMSTQSMHQTILIERIANELDVSTRVR